MVGSARSWEEIEHSLDQFMLTSNTPVDVLNGLAAGQIAVLAEFQAILSTDSGGLHYGSTPGFALTNDYSHIDWMRAISLRRDSDTRCGLLVL